MHPVNDDSPASVSDRHARSRQSKRSGGLLEEERAGGCQRDICLDDHVEQVVKRDPELTVSQVLFDDLQSVTQPKLVKPS
jgi:hypothetical protein